MPKQRTCFCFRQNTIFKCPSLKMLTALLARVLRASCPENSQSFQLYSQYSDRNCYTIRGAHRTSTSNNQCLRSFRCGRHSGSQTIVNCYQKCCKDYEQSLHSHVYLLACFSIRLLSYFCSPQLCIQGHQVCSLSHKCCVEGRTSPNFSVAQGLTHSIGWHSSLWCTANCLVLFKAWHWATQSLDASSESNSCSNKCESSQHCTAREWLKERLGHRYSIAVKEREVVVGQLVKLAWNLPAI